MISKTAVVETETIGSGTRIEEFAVIRTNAVLGENVVIHPHVVIESGVVLGEGVEVFPGTYIGKEPKGAGTTMRPPMVEERKVVVGSGCTIGPNAVIHYDVSIDENTLIGDGASIREQCIIGKGCIIGTHVTVGYNVRINNFVKVMEYTHVVGKSLVEDDVFISLNVAMANDPFLGARGYKEEDIRGVVIRRGALISLGATLLPGVEVGEQALVGVGAVVDRDIPAHKMGSGAPVKIFSKGLKEKFLNK